MLNRLASYSQFIFSSISSTMRIVAATAVLILLALGRLSFGQEAERCDSRFCRLPNCFCGGSKPPGGLKTEQTPQFVLLTFDDAVNGLNRKFFEDLFKNRVNPNGCPIKVGISTDRLNHMLTRFYLHVDYLEMACKERHVVHVKKVKKSQKCQKS